MITFTHKRTIFFAIVLLFFPYHYFFAPMTNIQLIQVNHIQDSNSSLIDTEIAPILLNEVEIQLIKTGKDAQPQGKDPDPDPGIQIGVTNSGGNPSETSIRNHENKEGDEKENHDQSKYENEIEGKNVEDQKKEEIVNVNVKEEEKEEEEREKEREKGKKEDEEKKEREKEKESGNNNNDNKHEKEETSVLIPLRELYSGLSTHITEGFNSHFCHQKDSIFFFFDFKIQETLFAQKLITQELVFQNKRFGENLNCSIGFVLYFIGEDELRNQIEGHGRINCDPNNKTYLANFVLPIPGFYTIKIETHYVGCEIFEPLTSTTREFNVTAIPPPFNISSFQCTQKDLENARLGYWYSQDSCQKPHCTGKLVQKKWMDANEFWSPFHCHLHFYSPESIIEKLSGKTIMFLGDSTTEELIESILLSMGFNEEVCFQYMRETITYTDEKGDFIVYNYFMHRLMTVISPKYNITFLHRYTGNVKLNETNMGAPSYWSEEGLNWIHSQFQNTSIPKIDLIVFNSGLHDQIGRYILRDDYLDRIKTLVSLMKNISETYQTKLLWKTSNPSNNLYRSQFFNSIATKVVQENQIPIVEIGGPCFSRINSIRGYSDGMHYGLSGIRNGATSMIVQEMMAQILLTAVFDLIS